MFNVQLSFLFANPAIHGRPGLIARRYRARSLKRIVDFKVVARLFVESVNVYRHARIGIIRSHVVIHGDRRRRRSGICRNVERLEHRISNHRDFRRSTIPGLWLICRRDHDSIVVAEITVLDSNRTISAARFHTLAQMEERTRDACTHALDVGIPDGDALRKIVSHPDARGPLLGIDQDRFVAAHGNGIDCQLIGRDNGQTLACRIPGAEVLDLPVPSECDSGLDRTIGFVIDELQHLLVCGVDRYGLTVIGHISTFEFRNPYSVERACRELEPKYIRVGGYVIPDVIVRPAEPKSAAFSTRIGTDTAVAAARGELAVTLRSHPEVVVEHVEALSAVLGDNAGAMGDRKSTRLNSSHQIISYAVFCLKK